MKLYLSSFRLGNHPEKLRELFTKNKRIAIIPNARENYDKDYKWNRLEGETQSLESLGLKPGIIDLKDYFGKSHELAKKLADFDGVWVVGGNTFVLRVAMHESGFDEWLKGKLTDKDFVYAGYSAGICVLAPTLEALDIVDDPNAVRQVYGKEVIWDGLDLIDYSYAPHYRSDHPESEKVEKEVASMVKKHMPFKTLKDGEVDIFEI